MDVGYFISELLGQHGDVSVPGLGYFVHTRINGYYNEPEDKFYPPRYDVQFDPQFIDDDSLAQHIADNKKISLASAKYFKEKYVANLKYLAATGETAVADIGWLSMDDQKLVFRTNNDIDTDPEFFGLPAVKMYKLGQQPAKVDEPVDEPAPLPEPIMEGEQQFETAEEHEAYLVQLTSKRKRKTLWVFITLAVLLTALIYFLYSKYDRSVFNLEETKTKAKKDSVARKPKKRVVAMLDTNKKVIGGDTIEIVKRNEGLKQYVTQVDTSRNKKPAIVAAAPAVAKDSIAGPHYEILGGSFKTIAQANAAIDNYKKMGFDARILNNVPGKNRKITLGTFATRAQAIAGQQKILNTGKLRAAELYIQPYDIK